MTYVDAHVHVWTDDLQRYPMAPAFDPKAIEPRVFLPEDIWRAARPAGVERIVLVQMSYYADDNRYMLDVMASDPDRFAGIGIVDPCKPDPDSRMLELASQNVRGFRVTNLDGPGMDRLFACAARHNLAICPLIGPDALPALTRLCERYPEAPVIIDHFCRIGAGGVVRHEDIDALCAMARFERVMVKVSAFYAWGAGPPHDDMAEPTRRLRDAFSARRLMWASDSPYQIVRQGAAYDDGLTAIRDRYNFLDDEDRLWILGKTAEQFFFA